MWVIFVGEAVEHAEGMVDGPPDISGLTCAGLFDFSTVKLAR